MINVSCKAGKRDRTRPRRTLREQWLNCLTELREVYELEVGKDPEEYVPLLSSRLNEWRAHSVKQMREYLSVIPEDDPIRCPISLFGTLGLGRIETAHTSALAWLLHPAQQHGLKSYLLDALLVHVAKSTGHRNVVVQEMLSEHRLDLSGKSLGRLDVFGTGTWITSDGVPGNWLLAIEAKIDAMEGDKQLERYNDWIDTFYCDNWETFRIFLTHEGRCPEANVTNWIPMSFLDLVRVFREPYSQLRDRVGFQFLRFYLTGVLKEICRWKVPVAAPESCDDPYGVVTYLKAIHRSSRGERIHDPVG
jgi:PD-(D/E)XK nuclease superfamily